MGCLDLVIMRSLVLDWFGDNMMVTVHLTVGRLLQKYVIRIQDKFGSW